MMKNDIEIKPEGEYFKVFCVSEKGRDKVYNEMKLAPGGRILALSEADAKSMARHLEDQGLKVKKSF
jgi:hypothetical protein